MSFYVTVTVNDTRKFLVRKLSFDKKTFYNVPSSLSELTNHPLIKKKSTFNQFKTSVDNRVNLTKDFGGFRNIKFNILKTNGTPTEEAL